MGVDACIEGGRDLRLPLVTPSLVQVKRGGEASSVVMKVAGGCRTVRGSVEAGTGSTQMAHKKAGEK